MYGQDLGYAGQVGLGVEQGGQPLGGQSGHATDLLAPHDHCLGSTGAVGHRQEERPRRRCPWRATSSAMAARVAEENRDSARSGSIGPR